jgi:phosphoglycolate phosphatase
MECKLVIFDFDGTLANSFPWVLNILDELAAKYKVKNYDRSSLPIMRNYPPRKIMKMHRVSIWKLPGMLKFTRGKMRKTAHSIERFDGVDRLLTSLTAKNIKLAIVTTNTREVVEQVLGKELFNLIHYFEGGISLFGKSKALKKVLRNSGIRNSDTLAIGDEIRDLDAALKVRIPFGAVSWGFSTLEAFMGRSPQYTFTHLDQINDLIELQPAL